MDARGNLCSGTAAVQGGNVMSISINVSAKTDYSYLFSSLSTSSSGSSGLSSFLSDYASIKNGSYGKLMKAYYSENSSSTVKSLAESSTSSTSKTTSTATKKLNAVQTTADALKDSADALLASGSESLFEQTNITTTDENGLESTTKGYDTDAIYSAVNKFVKNYNSVINAVDNADNTIVTNRGASLANITSSNENALNKVGITVDDDGTLSIDKDAFMKADMGSVKNLFNGSGSYGYQVSAQASIIDYAAGSEASVASLYTGSGTYSSTLSTGSLYNSYF
jgi:hypothetical protein